jgi:hypothetical protein
MGSGDPSGLQNQRELVNPALVGSTPTRFRQLLRGSFDSRLRRFAQDFACGLPRPQNGSTSKPARVGKPGSGRFDSDTLPPASLLASGVKRPSASLLFSASPRLRGETTSCFSPRLRGENYLLPPPCLSASVVNKTLRASVGENHLLPDLETLSRPFWRLSPDLKRL